MSAPDRGGQPVRLQQTHTAPAPPAATPEEVEALRSTVAAQADAIAALTEQVTTLTALVNP